MSTDQAIVRESVKQKCADTTPRKALSPFEHYALPAGNGARTVRIHNDSEVVLTVHNVPDGNKTLVPALIEVLENELRLQSN